MTFLTQHRKQDNETIRKLDLIKTKALATEGSVAK